MLKLGKPSAVTTVPLARASSSFMRRAALMPASLPPMMSMGSILLPRSCGAWFPGSFKIYISIYYELSIL